jgi:hypothetical protein
MNFKQTSLGLVVATLVGACLLGCNEQKVVATTVAQPDAPNAASLPAMPSIYESAELRDFALATDIALHQLVVAAKGSQDPAVTDPLVRNFIEKREALRGSLNSTAMQISALREVVQKNVVAPQDRAAYARAMTAYHKTHPLPAVEPESAK